MILVSFLEKFARIAALLPIWEEKFARIAALLPLLKNKKYKYGIPGLGLRLCGTSIILRWRNEEHGGAVPQMQDTTEGGIAGGGVQCAECGTAVNVAGEEQPRPEFQSSEGCL